MLNWLRGVWGKVKGFVRALFARPRSQEQEQEQRQAVRKVVRICAALAGAALGYVAAKLLAPVLVTLAWLVFVVFLLAAIVGCIALGGYTGWWLVGRIA